LLIDFAAERAWTINTPLDKDWRPSAGLRVSPHFFNTDEEVEEALNILAELIE
jgi:selenocysteine lyase/cysteine desulfurase